MTDVNDTKMNSPKPQPQGYFKTLKADIRELVTGIAINIDRGRVIEALAAEGRLTDFVARHGKIILNPDIASSTDLQSVRENWNQVIFQFQDKIEDLFRNSSQAGELQKVVKALDAAFRSNDDAALRSSLRENGRQLIAGIIITTAVRAKTPTLGAAKVEKNLIKNARALSETINELAAADKSLGKLVGEKVATQLQGERSTIELNALNELVKLNGVGPTIQSPGLPGL